MEKFRQGQDPSEFAHPPKPKKKIRGSVLTSYSSLTSTKFVSDGVPLCSTASAFGLVSFNRQCTVYPGTRNYIKDPSRAIILQRWEHYTLRCIIYNRLVLNLSSPLA